MKNSTLAHFSTVKLIDFGRVAIRVKVEVFSDRTFEPNFTYFLVKNVRNMQLFSRFLIEYCLKIIQKIIVLEFYFALGNEDPNQ